MQYIFDAIKKTVYNGADVELDKNLINWSNQGVLLLNSAFTCQIGKPGTHYEIWKEFMAFAIDMMSYGLEKTVWVFMGKKSQELSELVDEDKHIIINTSHPASAVYTGKKEWDCNDVFNKVNEALLEKNGFLRKDAKTLDVTAENSFNTETYLNSPSSDASRNVHFAPFKS